MAAESKARRLQAAESAGRLLAEAGVDQTRPVDVFGLCEQLGLWLAFFPLDGLLGSYLPEGSGGVIVTTQRPVAIQRYTAAHELGHWRLHHGRGPVLDDEQQVLGDTQDESEQLAQIFAAALLMPPPLIRSTLRRLGVEGDVSPLHAYTVAREAGVSYEAAVRQLMHLSVVSRFRANELLRVRPRDIKTEIGSGRRPAVGTANVWPVDEQWDGQRLSVHTDDEIVISLPENRSTAYRWFFAGHEPDRDSAPEPPKRQFTDVAGQLALDVRTANVRERMRQKGSRSVRAPRAALDLARAAGAEPLNPSLEIDGRMTLVGDRYITARAPEMSDRDAGKARLARLDATTSGVEPAVSQSEASPVVGATGRRILSVRFLHPGLSALRLNHQSAYGIRDGAIERFALDVDVKPRRRGLSIEQLLTERNPEWAEDVRARQSAFAHSDLKSHISTRDT